MTTPRRPGHGGGTGPGGGGTGPGGGEPGGHHSPWFRAANLPEQPGPPEQPAPLDRTARIERVEPAEPSRPRPRAERGGPERDGARGRLPGPLPPEAPPPRTTGPETPATGGRAERRRAAKARGRRGAGHRAAPGGGRSAGRHSAAQGAPGAGGPSAGAGGRPLTRVEARRAARARKDSVGVVASRVVGELFITFGVVMLLFVTYQLWWTNVRAGIQADQAKKGIENAWAEGRKPGAFEPGQGFAIMYLPTLDVVVPIAEGIDKERVLDRGMVGHYAEGRLKTAMPSDRQGNFAVAGHRNTHGEPFRYINRLRPGDPIVVETQDTYYTYEMASILPQTEPSNVSVIGPVPAGSGFTGPGRYLTLTTCTPEFTSTYRMIVWGKMVEERPRSKGKPDALVS
ncbi:class E sortase [Streptomyces sp. NPDC046887]|uniref:class E sortase n=1 Tax=Streptomyces sp. NPDC046887 TaxID=3155472 RepID=UPI0033DD8C1F